MNLKQFNIKIQYSLYLFYSVFFHVQLVKHSRSITRDTTTSK